MFLQRKGMRNKDCFILEDEDNVFLQNVITLTYKHSVTCQTEYMILQHHSCENFESCNLKSNVQISSTLLP